MTQEEIINGSKLIAEYLGWKYIPFNDLQDFPKAGWYKQAPNNLIIVSPKQGFPIKVKDRFYKYICRKHSELRFYNSMDALLPVIEKLNKDKIEINLAVKGGWCMHIDPEEDFYFKSFEENLSWEQNTFNIVVESLKYFKKNKL